MSQGLRVQVAVVATIGIPFSVLGQSLFTRGDMNGDGAVTLADAVLLGRAVVSRSELPCPDAADFTDNGLVQLGDAGLLAEYLIKGSPEPPGPFPAPGSDPTEDELPCAAVEPSPAGEDLSSGYSLSVLPAPGGASGLRLRVSLENSRPAIGGRLVVGLPDGWSEDSQVLEARPSLELATILKEDGIVAAHVGRDRKLRLLWLLSLSESGAPLQARASRHLFDVTLCPGSTPPGEYRLEPEPGAGSELVTEDGRGWSVAVGGTSMSVESAGVACPERKPDASTMRSYLWAGDARAEVGGTFRLSLYGTTNIEAETMIYGFQWDPEVLRVTGAEQTRAESFIWGSIRNFDGRRTGPEYIPIVKHLILPNGQGGCPGCGLTLCDPCNQPRSSAPRATIRIRNHVVRVEPRRPFPVDTEMHHLDVIFEVLPGAEPGEAWIELRDNPRTPIAREHGIIPFLSPRPLDAPEFPARPILWARVEILPASGKRVFVRGDTNRDGELGLSDPIQLLGALFQAGKVFRVSCEDAADSNDDGKLDISDALYTLSFLFIGGSAPPPPFPEPGTDPTADDLGCEP